MHVTAHPTPTPSGVRARLVFILGEERREFALQDAPFSIGRKAEKELPLLNPRVSRDHARIFRENDCFFVEDQGSKHGTFVNGERVTRHRLQPNDRIEFGALGEGHLLFDPAEGSSGAREFLSQFASTSRRSQEISDLEMLTLFLEAARKLNTGGVLGDVLITLLNTLLKLTRSERGYIFLRGETGAFRLAAGRDDKGKELTDDSTISQSILKEAISSGSEFLVTDDADVSKLAGRHSVMAQQLRTVICIPLRGSSIKAEHKEGGGCAPDEVRAVVYLDSHSLSGKLSSVSHDILRAVAREAGTLVENARLVQSEQAARRYQQELAIAASIQQGLMMVEIPKVPFARVQAKSIPCTEIGGDFFDIIATEKDLSVVVADVCGKGVSAAILASIIQGMAYAQLTQRRALDDMAAAANRFLCERNVGEKYATLFVARLHPSGHLEYLNCGHVPPLLVSKQGVRSLETSNLPVGLMEDASFTVGHIDLAKGDRLLVVTDGVTEAENAAAEFFGFERLQAALEKGERLTTLLQSVTEYCQGIPLHDDCTALELDFCG